ncbi:acyl dehydratase [Streptomyces griseoviridis]|uniref:Acyl dehydratase n=1 Tax=Streptomyces griseoviridis TaxID=45398 RepID=A0ABT9LCW4_STRGD|nr:acyl dehydratase [Streptomyces griseoviridis]GGS74401.1 hypothetical protein GCM10010240_04310 [Streptomyces griseoviridis]
MTRVREYRARFTGVVYPGETLRVRMWEGPRGVTVTAGAVERGDTRAPVLTGVVGIRGTGATEAAG